MKKVLKTLALCLSVLALTAFFAGCDAIDELRANHAILSDDRQSIIYNGELYKRLPDVKEEDTFYWSSGTNNINVTDKDVPVLLSDSLCHFSNYDKERDIITISFADLPGSAQLIYSDYFAIGFDARYCNAKDYDKYSEAIESNQLDRLGFQYEVYEKDEKYITIQAGGENLSKEVLGHIENNEKMTTQTYEKLYEENSTHPLLYTLLLCDAYGVNIDYTAVSGYDLVRTNSGEVYLTNEIECTAVELSSEAVYELKDEYFLKSSENSVEYIGYADSETDYFVIYD